MKKKWLLAAVGLIIIAEIIFIISASSRKPVPTQTPDPSQQVPSIPADQTDQSIQSVELQKAIAEQMKVDKEYSTWREKVQTEHSWINKMPLASDKYFIYFDLDKDMFVGRLYPRGGEDVELIKTDALKQLKDNKGVPVEDFKFDWVVSPK